jgi:hypothetical protein
MSDNLEVLLEAALRLPPDEQRQLAEHLPAGARLAAQARLAEEAERVIVDELYGTIKGLDRETIIWLAEMRSCVDIKALPAGEAVLVDANIIIYYLGGVSAECRDFFQRVARREVEAHITTTIIAETLPRRKPLVNVLLHRSYKVYCC